MKEKLNATLFIDITLKDTEKYWKPLRQVFEDYIDHAETKFDGDIGKLKKKTIEFDKSSIVYIGKETDNLEESDVLGVKKSNYTHYLEIHKKIQEMNEKKSFVLPRSTLYNIKKKMKSGSTFRLSKKKRSKIKLSKK